MGSFSWIAQNSGRSIIIHQFGTRQFPSKTYYMWDNKGRRWREPKYEGYGEFGGKDYYVLLAEMNNVYGPDVTDNEKRNDGLGLEGGSFLHPNLTDCPNWKWKNLSPDSCPQQGSQDHDWGSAYYDENEDRRQFHEEDKYDEWPNGETKPISPILGKINSDHKNGQLHGKTRNADEEKYHHVHEKIENDYEIVLHKSGVFVNGNILKNPIWVVKEKDDRQRPYDTTFVIICCNDGIELHLSVCDMKRIDDFCDAHGERLILYVKTDAVFGHCMFPANLGEMNKLLESIYSNPIKPPKIIDSSKTSFVF